MRTVTVATVSIFAVVAIVLGRFEVPTAPVSAPALAAETASTPIVSYQLQPLLLAGVKGCGRYFRQDTEKTLQYELQKFKDGELYESSLVSQVPIEKIWIQDAPADTVPRVHFYEDPGSSVAMVVISMSPAVQVESQECLKGVRKVRISQPSTRA